MFLSADTLTYLMRLGLDGDKLVELVRRLDADAQAMAPVLDPIREKKRERDRARYQRRIHGETGAESAAENAAETGAESEAKPPPESAATDAHIRGENNLSRLEDTSSGVGVVGGDARKPDQQTDDWPEGSAKHHADLIVRVVACHWLDPQRAPTLVTTTARIAAWKRAGASWEHDVLPVITGACQNRRSRINGWQYFDPAIARSIADNRAALDIPEATPRKPGTGPPVSITDRIADERRRATELTLESLRTANG